MPALVNIKVGSSLITIGADGTILCPFSLKKRLKESRISFAVSIVYQSVNIFQNGQVQLAAKLGIFDYFCNTMKPDDTLDKRFYKIRDVAEMLDIPQPTLRFWEKEFPRLKPHRNAGGTRFYTPADIKLLRNIHYLVKIKGLKIASAREALASNDNETERKAAALERLRNIRQTLESLREALTKRRS